MPYTVPHWLITVFGDSWTQTETWQFGVRATIEGAVPPAEQQNLANALATPTSTFFSTTALYASTNVRLLGIKAALINTDGHYTYNSAPGIYTYPTPVAGTSSTNTFPQVTVAITTLTAVSRGRASKGRFYLPPGGWTTQADGRITTTVADQIETAARTWLLAINATTQVTAASVMSKLGDGTTNSITGVGVGRTVDTMRSRRRALAEGRTPLPL